MDPIEKRELKRKAWMRLAAQRRRAGMLRGRVLVLSLICFVLLWGIVFGQMVTGNDPVLAGKETAVATRAATNPGRKIKSTEPRRVGSEHETDSGALPREEEGGAEKEAEFEEPQVEEVEFEEVEPEPEVVEPEPLVTSQS